VETEPRARFLTRRGNDWSGRFPLVVEAVNHLRVRSCLMTARWCAVTIPKAVLKTIKLAAAIKLSEEVPVFIEVRAT
jgi:ATP-dependent DNA ligase